MSEEIEFLERCKRLGLHDGPISVWVDRIERLERELAEANEMLTVAHQTSDLNANALEETQRQLAECQRKCDYWKGVADSENDARTEMSNRLDECQRERDEAKVDQLQWLTYRHVIGRVEDLEKENFSLLSALIQARKWIGDGENSDGLPREYWTNEYIAAVEMIDAAIAKVGAEKGENNEQ